MREQVRALNPPIRTLRQGRAGVRLGIALAFALGAALCPTTASAQTVIGFEDLTPDTIVPPDHYQPQGVVFYTDVSGQRVVRAAPAGEAQSGTNVVEITHTPAPTVSAIGPEPRTVLAVLQFTSPQSSVSLWTGQFDTRQQLMVQGCTIAMTAFDSEKVSLGSATEDLPAIAGVGFHTRLSMTTPEASITQVALSVPTAGCLSARVGIDDITLGVADTSVIVRVDGPGRVSGGGIECPVTCSSSYPPGTALSLSAAPTSGSLFTGWTGACAPAETTCSLVVGSAATSIVATFRAPTLRMAVTGAGKGTVGSVPTGIDCGTTCVSDFPGDSTVTLNATADAASIFDGWVGACAGSTSPTCQVVLHGDQSVQAHFSLRPIIIPNKPPIVIVDSGPEVHASDIDAGGIPAPALPPPPTKSLVVDVSGSGTVETANGLTNARWAGPALPALHLASIRCGITGFVCFSTATPGSRVGLIARPGPGQIFVGWGGACAGTARTCFTSLSKNGSVSARFETRVGRAVTATLRRPHFRIRWTRSTGAGTLQLTGEVNKPSVLRLQLRRPFGGPLLTETLSTGAGAFKHTTVLRPGILKHGARLFPGGFIVSLQGRSGTTKLPPELQTVQLLGPPGGVVQKAYETATPDGEPTTSVPSSGASVWAHFIFNTQPRTNLPLTVNWYLPSGRLLGTVPKTNRPEIVSWIQAPVPLPRGDWTVKLVAAGTVVSALRVRVE